MNDEHAKSSKDKSRPMEMINPQRECFEELGEPFFSEEIAEATRRSKSDVGGRTTQEVFDRLSKLGAS